MKSTKHRSRSVEIWIRRGIDPLLYMTLSQCEINGLDKKPLMSFPAEREAWETSVSKQTREPVTACFEKQAQAKKVPKFVVKGPHCLYNRRKVRIRAPEAKDRKPGREPLVA